MSAFFCNIPAKTYFAKMCEIQVVCTAFILMNKIKTKKNFKENLNYHLKLIELPAS